MSNQLEKNEGMSHIDLVREFEANGDILTIHIVSKSESKETFWCFLAKPEKLNTGTEIFANSSARLTIDKDSDPQASFGIPIQFSLAATSVNKPVGLGIAVSTRQKRNVELKESWKGIFYVGEDHQAPDLKSLSEPASDGSINYISNAFEPDEAIRNDWYPSQSYGMQTQAGFVGITWDARPSKTIIIEPLVEFYIATGDYKAGTLANLTTISNNSANVKLNAFKGKEATVTYGSDGSWKVTSGRPSLLISAEI
jgi:hypothetical protein